MLFRNQILFVILTAISMVLAACSGRSNPVMLAVQYQNTNDETLTSSMIITNRLDIAMYDVAINTDAMTIEIAPSVRDCDYHFPLTQLYPNVLQIVDYGFTPNFWADIKITHPLPGSGIDAFDPRVIAILPANPGVSFNYPIFNVVGNNKVVLNYDDYTKMYDNLGGNIPGNTNPYKAYFKNQPFRRWSSIDPISEIQRWEMDLSGFGGPISFKLVVDISTNYPDYPEPDYDNAREPVQINAVVEDGLHANGGSAIIMVTLKDWQGYQDIECKIESPDIFSGVIELYYAGPGSDPHDYLFLAIIPNELLAPAGEYHVLVAAWDIPSGSYVFDEAVASVSSDAPFNLVDITPTGLDYTSEDIFISGNYLYLAGGLEGLHILDISDPRNPVWVNTITTLNNTWKVFVSDGYAYISDEDQGFQIVDIDPPDSAFVVKSMDTWYEISDFFISEGYAYVIRSLALYIIDIDPPESAYPVKLVNVPGRKIYVSNDYAYVNADWYQGNEYISGLSLLDINPPESTYEVKFITTPGTLDDVVVANGYAYVSDYYTGLRIIDVDPPETAYTVFAVHGGYEHLFFADGYVFTDALQVIDVEPAEFAHWVDSLYVANSNGLFVSGDYSYCATRDGLKIISLR